MPGADSLDLEKSEKTRWTLQDRQNSQEPWLLCYEFFGEGKRDVEIYDFGAPNYTLFLDRATSKPVLIEGLCQLSPLADDALKLAEGLSPVEFLEFRETLTKERSGTHTHRTSKFFEILVPRGFVEAQIISEIFEVSLGHTLIGLMELGQQRFPPHGNTL